MEISLQLLVLSILFLIYICSLFNKISKSYLAIMSLLFMDNLGFLMSRYSVKKLSKILEQVAMVVLEWWKSNIFIYDVAKSKAILFSKSHSLVIN